MTADDMVVVEIASGKVVEGSKSPRPIRQRIWHFTVAMPKLVALCIPTRATPPSGHRPGWISPHWGTTHADYFYGAIPCTRLMTAEEINGEYEYQTGEVIIETFEERGRSPAQIPAVLVHSHGPFAREKMPPMRCITPWCWKSVPIWACSRASLRRSSLRCKTNCWINTTCVSMETMPITGSNPSRRGFIAPALRIDMFLAVTPLPRCWR